MEITEKERFALALLEMISKKREEIKTLTSDITELENDLSPNNIMKIKQDIQGIVNAIASFTSGSDGLFLHSSEFEANRLLTKLNEYQDDKNKVNSIFKKDKHLRFSLDQFCTMVNTWNPMEFDFSKKGLKIDLKNVNIGVNIIK